MHARSKELQTFGPTSRLETRCVGCVVARTWYDLFVVDFVWLEVVSDAAVVEETRLVAESLARQEHALRLFVWVLVRII